MYATFVLLAGRTGCRSVAYHVAWMPTKTARPLKVGLFLSVAEGSAGARWNNLKAMAQHAERPALILSG
jgi:hypothetical protein